MSSELAALAELEDAAPEARLRAAEVIGRAIADRRSPPIAEPRWTALPSRLDIASCAARRAAIGRMLAWAEAAGARWDGIAFQVDGDGNASVLAARSLAPGEPILTLPRRLMIIDNELGGATRPLDPRDALAAWLPRAAREPASRWRPYLDALPVRLAELPMFHDAEDLDALAGTAAHAFATDDNRDVLAAYHRVSPDVSLADFAWGCAIVKSRGYHAPGTLEHRIALLPLVDLFDHRLGDTTWSYAGDFVVSTERAFAIGDAVHMSYGDRSNSRLLVNFGFTVPGNPADEAGLRFDVPADPVNALAAHLLWQLSLDQPARICVAACLDHRFRRALSLARLHVSGPADRARALEAGLAPSGDLPWLGGALEEAAFAVIAAAARRALGELAAHPSTQTAWGRTCSVVRDGERAVLAEILEVASTVHAYLGWRDPARIRAAAVGARGLLRQYLQALADELT